MNALLCDDFKEDLSATEKRLRNELKQTESNLTKRIDALDEDLTATMRDTITIRQHIGIPVVSE